MEWKLEGTSIPNPSEVAGILESLAPETYYQIRTEMDFQKRICTDKNLKAVRVHPRFEMFAKDMMVMPYREASRAELWVNPAYPEYEMHLCYADHTEIIELNKE